MGNYIRGTPFRLGPVAQWLERGTHNPLVAGSIPARPTTTTRSPASDGFVIPPAAIRTGRRPVKSLFATYAVAVPVEMGPVARLTSVDRCGPSSACFGAVLVGGAVVGWSRWCCSSRCGWAFRASCRSSRGTCFQHLPQGVAFACGYRQRVLELYAHPLGCIGTPVVLVVWPPLVGGLVALRAV